MPPAARLRTAQANGPAKSAFPNVTPDVIRQAFETGTYPYSERLMRKDYETQKAALQAELLARIIHEAA